MFSRIKEWLSSKSEETRAVLNVIFCVVFTILVIIGAVKMFATLSLDFKAVVFIIFIIAVFLGYTGFAIYKLVKIMHKH